MDTLNQIFFESPFFLGLFCFAAFAFVLFWRLRMESPVARRRAIPLSLGIFVLLFIMQALVVTSREEILSQMDDFVRAFEREDANGAAVVVSDAFESNGIDRAAFVESFSDWFERIDVRDTRYQRRDVTFTNDRATLRLAVTSTVSLHKGPAQTHLAVFDIDWREEQGAWRMTAVRPVSVDAIPVKNLAELRGLAR